jgi:ComF family protein
VQVLQLAKDFIGLFYPEVCICCGAGLNAKEELVCTMCIYKLPKTNFHKYAENPLAKVFWGRVDISSVAAYCHYQKGNKVQDLVHELKYNGKKELGNYLGDWYGHDLKTSPLFNKADLIIYIPLHPSKLRKRGYNQSAHFAEGLSQSMGIPVLHAALSRTKNTDTQTRKSRYERWENVEGIFKVEKADEMKGKHVLLVDDIITTGATIEACVVELNKAGVGAVSVAAIGSADIITSV